ncbi:MAG: hypothetical protein M1831_000959 [Alyxoria varia]|nr:MAG: hypothetical protein M1831_000959 [Alyxoria varia]
MEFLTVFLVFSILAVSVGAVVYFMGVPSEWKEAAQRNVIENLGENAARDAMKDKLDKIPESNASGADIKDNVKGFASNIQNTLGKKD